MPDTTSALRHRPMRWLACLLAVITITAACGGGGDSDGADEEAGGDTGTGAEDTTTTTEALGEAVAGGSIDVGLEAETNSWLPGQVAASNAGYNVLYSIYDPFMARSDEGQLKPFLAESLEPNAELTEWTLKLRPDVVFHDGTALDATVVKTIFDEYLKIPAANTSGALEDVSEVRVVDDLTVTYVLTEANAAFADLLEGPIGMPFSVEAAAASGENAGSEPVGTGPFVFTDWQRDSALLVEKNPDYWIEGLPYLDSITFRPIPDEDARIQSLLAGDVDAMHTLRGSSIKQVIEAEESGGFATFVNNGNLSGVSIYNTLVPPLDDKRIRTALAHSSDPDSVAAVLGDDGLVDTTTQFYSMDSPWWSQKVADAYPKYDPEAGAALVEEYMADPDRSDGLPVGTPPQMKYNCPPDPSLIEVAQLIQGQAAAVGIQVELGQVEQAAHIANGLGSPDSDPPLKGDYVANCWRLGSENDPYTEFTANYGPPETSILNVTNFQSDELDAMIEELRTTADFDARYAIVEEIGLFLNDEMPQSWGVGTPTAIGAVDAIKNLPGWTFPDGSLGAGPTTGIGRWGQVWLEE